MSRRSAPTALRTPISRVRSVTETSMMFITPTPPISSEIDAMNTIASVIPPVIALEVLDQLVGRDDPEVVRLVERHLPARAQHRGPLLDDPVDQVGLRRDGRDVDALLAS